MSANTFQIIREICGPAALLLAILNTWESRGRHRAKLSVTCTQKTFGGGFGAAQMEFSLKVENRGNFAVTVEDAGITFLKSEVPAIEFGRLIRLNEGDLKTDSLPLRIKSYESMTLTGMAEDNIIQRCRPKFAYIRLGDGSVIKVKIV